jgi:hypothetical protein
MTNPIVILDPHCRTTNKLFSNAVLVRLRPLCDLLWERSTLLLSWSVARVPTYLHC